jgi:hypothetical protein
MKRVAFLAATFASTKPMRRRAPPMILAFYRARVHAAAVA